MEKQYRNMETPKKIIEPLITVPKPRPQIHHQVQQQTYHRQQQQQQQRNFNGTSSDLVPEIPKYTQLLHVIGDLGQYIRPSYAGNRGSAEKIRQGIIKARILVRECLVETEKIARQ